MSPEDKQLQRRKNVRLGLTLGAIALAFFVLVILKHVLAN
jgi:hypothetical protein